MQKALTFIIVLLSFPVCALAQGKPERGLKVDVNRKPLAFTGDEEPATAARPHSGNNTAAQGPGKFLLTSYYDYGSNGGVLNNIVDYGDGTLAVARMGATLSNTSDRGTYWAYFDSRAWSPMVKVETIRRGWSNLAALMNGRSVTVSHIAHEVNVDTLKGLGVWRSSITGFATPTPTAWPRLTIDGRNNIVICSTLSGTEAGIANRKEVAISRDGGLTWLNRSLFPDTTRRLPQFTADDQAIDSFGDRIAIAAAERGGDIHLWQSSDNGRNWSYRNVTNYPADIPVGNDEKRPWDTCDLIYDNAGNVHLFWEAVRATQDVPGTALELFHDRNVGIQHWSQAAGITQAATWADLPGAASEPDNTLFRAGSPFQQINADATLTMQPQAGVDASGNFYLSFAAYRPFDFDSDSTHFTDIYAVGSSDGGESWGAPVNVTDTPQSEDLWASLADNIGDSLRFVYQSDGTTGNSIQAGGAAPTTLLYHAFAKSQIRFAVPPVRISLPDSLTGSPGRIIEVPVTLGLDGNSVAALGATIKASNKIFSFAGFTPGPIIPGERFSVNAPTPDSVLVAFTDFGGGPIQRDGVLATLRFRISPQAEAGTIARLDFRQVFATDPQFTRLPIRSISSQVKIVLQSVTFSIADTLTGAPGDTIAVPVQLTRSDQPIEALGAAIKARNDLLTFVSFVPGPIIPGPTLNVNAPAPDSVRLAYINFGGGPIIADGVLVTLKYRIKTSATSGASTELTFSNLTATDPTFRVLPVSSLSGKITVVIQPPEIHGVKWNDLNGDGRRDSNEPGIKGWTINLTGAATLSTTTDSLGNYRFTQLAPGNYTVAEVLQIGWLQTFPPAPGTHAVTLRSGQMLTNLDFGNWMPGSLQGLVWHDRNLNGKKDPGESSLIDWQINLTGAATRSTKTDTGGNYRFENLGPGAYKISQVLKPRWRQTFPAPPDSAYMVDLKPGQAIRDLNFASEPPVAVDQKDEAIVPEDFALWQNYPNPFSPLTRGIFDNPGTTIKYAVPRQGFVKIEVFNTLGVRVAVLVNRIHQPGHYAVKLERLDLPGGLYIYKLTAPGWVATKKMLLMK